MAIIIPHQLPLHPSSPIPPPVFSGPLPNPQRSAFLFPSVRFFVSSNLLSRFLRSAILFPLACSFVSFVSLACSFWSVFLFPLFRFFVSFGPLLRSLCSVFLFPLFRFFVSFGPLLPFFRTPLLFSSARFPVSFGPLFCFLRSASPFLLYPAFVFFVLLLRFFRPAPSFSSVRFLFLLVWFYEALPRSQLFPLLVLSLLLSVIFAPLKSDTCPSTFEKMLFNVRDNALLAPRPRPSTFKNTPFSSRLRMCLISCQLQVPFRFIPSSQRRDFRVCSC